MHDAQLRPVHGVREQHRLAAAEMADADHEARTRRLLVDPPLDRLEEQVRPVHRVAVGQAPDRAGQHRHRAARIAEMVVQVHGSLPVQVIGEDAGLDEVEQLPQRRARARRAGPPGQPERAEPAARAAAQRPQVARDHPVRGARGLKDAEGRGFFRLLVGAHHVLGVGPAHGAGQHLGPLRAQRRHLALDEGVRHLRIDPGQIGDGAGGGGIRLGRHWRMPVSFLRARISAAPSHRPRRDCGSGPASGPGYGAAPAGPARCSVASVASAA